MEDRRQRFGSTVVDLDIGSTLSKSSQRRNIFTVLEVKRPSRCTERSLADPGFAGVRGGPHARPYECGFNRPEREPKREENKTSIAKSSPIDPPMPRSSSRPDTPRCS